MLLSTQPESGVVHNHVWQHEHSAYYTIMVIICGNHRLQLHREHIVYLNLERRVGCYE